MQFGDFNISPLHFSTKKFGRFNFFFFLFIVKQKEIKNKKIKNITWETDGEEVELPTEVDLPNGIEPDDDDAINDYLSDTYGWLVIDWRIVARYEVYDHNDEVIDANDNLQMAQISAENDNAKFIFDTETNEIVWGRL